MNRRFIGIILSGIIIFLLGGCSQQDKNLNQDLPEELILPNSGMKYEEDAEELEKELKEELANNIAERENVKLDNDSQILFNETKKIKDIQVSINDDPINYYEIIIRFIKNDDINTIHEYSIYRSENARYSFTIDSLKDFTNVEYARYRLIQDGQVTVETITPEYVDIAGENGWGEHAIEKDTDKIEKSFHNRMCRLYNKE